MKVEQLLNRVLALPTRIKSVFLTTFIVGIMTHGYVLCNKFSNSDDLLNIRAYGAGINNGRWLQELLGPVVSKFCGNYTNPWANGILSLLLLSIAAVFTIEALDIKSIANRILIASIMVVFPSIASNFAVGYIAIYFSLAILMSVISVWLLARRNKVYHIILSIFLLAGSMGIYQAYFPLAASLLLIILIKECLTIQVDLKKELLRSLKFLACLTGGMATYFVISKFFLVFTHQTMSSRRDLDKMGQLHLQDIIDAIAQIYKNMFLMVTSGYMGISTHGVIKFVIVLCWGSVLVILVSNFIKSRKSKRCVLVMLGGLLWTIFPIAINLIDIMVANTSYSIYLLMTYSLCCIFILPITLLDNYYTKTGIQWGVFLAGCMVVFYYFNLNNAAYICADLAQRSVESYYTTLVSQIKGAPGYSADKKIVFVGHVSDPTLYLLSKEFEGISITGVATGAYKADGTKEGLLKYYCGFCPEYTMDYGAENAELVANMPSYPDDGSIQVLDDLVIVKFSEETTDDTK